MENLYLIYKDYTKDFDYYEFVNDISLRINDRSRDSYSLHFPTYIIGFSKEGYNNIKEYTSICGTILGNEFGLFLELDDNIHFQVNNKNIPDYVYEILTKTGKPLHIDDIYRILNADCPGLTKNRESLRAHCQRDERLIFFGRSSTYGLKKWESENDNIKGGTIRQIVQEYLISKESPAHLIELLDYVSKYRDNTNIKSILGNLKLDSAEPYIFFNQGFIGLKSMSKNPDYRHYFHIPRQFGKSISKLIRRNLTHINDIVGHFSSEFNLKVSIIEFAIEYQIYLGFLSKKDNHLYNLYNISKPQRESSAYKSEVWEDNFSELRKFIEKNNRLPRKDDTQSLFTFYYRQVSARLNNGTLLPVHQEKVKTLNLDNLKRSRVRPRISLDTISTYQRLYNFISQNMRLPKTRLSSEEDHLYRFLNKKSKEYKSGLLTYDESTHHKKILNLIRDIYEN